MPLSKCIVTDRSKEAALNLYGSYLREVNLWKLNDKPINENEDAAWEVIKGAHCVALQDDKMWHFFYEGPYNIIRCLEEFYESLLQYLQECGVEYVEGGIWHDSSQTVREYQQIYMHLFHNFTMMALQEYHWTKMPHILDRVVHCFLDHQYFTLGKYREFYGDLWEAKLITENGMLRADYIGYCRGVGTEKKSWQKWACTREEEIKNKVKEMNWFKKFLIKKVFKLV